MSESPGNRVLGRALFENMAAAIQSLGGGFLEHPANEDLRLRLASGVIAPTDFLGELLRATFRLLLLLIAEDRELVPGGRLSPEASEFYSLECSISRLLAADDLSTRPGRSLWEDVARDARSAGRPGGDPARGVPFLGGALFSRTACPTLEASSLADERLVEVVTRLGNTDGRPPAELSGLDLGAAYEGLLELAPVISVSDRRFSLADTARTRRSNGAFYTPPALVAALLNEALEPLLEKACSAPNAEAALLALRVLDPAAGSGTFLIAAARRIAARITSIRSAAGGDQAELARRALAEVISRCIYGIDIDPMAVELCRLGLWLEAAEPGQDLTQLDDKVVCGNALLGATPTLISRGVPTNAFHARDGAPTRAAKSAKRRNDRERAGQSALFAFDGEQNVEPSPDPQQVDRERDAADAWCAAFLLADESESDLVVTTDLVMALRSGALPIADRVRDVIRDVAERHRVLHPHLAFPQVFRVPLAGETPSDEGQGWSGGFDAVLGNPPFIRPRSASGELELAAARFGGDRLPNLSAQFLVLGLQMLRPQGRLAFVEPQSVLAARDAAAARSAAAELGTLTWLWVAGEPMFDASVFVCALAFERAPTESTVVRRSLGPDFSELPSQTLSRTAFRSKPTWSDLIPEAFGALGIEVLGAKTVGSIAECTSDYLEQYYDLIPFVYEGQDVGESTDPILVTSGLIDLAECLWGRRSTRFGKNRFARPRVDVRRLARESELGAWAQRRLVPKVLVATQTRVLETVVDERGTWIPSVPVTTVMSERESLWKIAAALSSPPLTLWALRAYGGVALGAQAINLGPRQLADAPLPADERAWIDGSRCFEVASATDDAARRREMVVEMGRAMCRAYRVPEEEVMSWWLERLPRPRDRAAPPTQTP